jgi:anti-sigma factor ChrR (cupin superfamily)
MITEQQQELASLYALGALSEAETRAFETELRGQAELADLVRDLQGVADLLVLAAPAISPPAALREKVLRRIDDSTALKPAKNKPSPDVMTGLRFLNSADQEPWKPLPIPGTYIKLLSLESDRSYAVLLGKLDPGARYPAHRNAGPEDFYILTGDLVIGDRRLGAGDFHHADSGSQHAENYSVAGCTLLAVLTTDDPLVAFAMA